MSLRLLLLVVLSLIADAQQREHTTCIQDYFPCGGAVLGPVPHIACCNTSFYCYTRGPYFSQCRPLTERDHARVVAAADLCGVSGGVCGAGASPDHTLPCCDRRDACRPAGPLYWLCQPRAALAWHWVRVQGRDRFTFARRSTTSSRLVEMQLAHKIAALNSSTRASAFRAVLPVMSTQQLGAFEMLLRRVVGPRARVEVLQGGAYVRDVPKHMWMDVVQRVARLVEIGPLHLL